MSARICRHCGEPRNEKTGTCRNGCDQVTARPIGTEFMTTARGLLPGGPVRTVVDGGLRRLPTDRESGERN